VLYKQEKSRAESLWVTDFTGDREQKARNNAKKKKKRAMRPSKTRPFESIWTEGRVIEAKRSQKNDATKRLRNDGKNRRGAGDRGSINRSEGDGVSTDLSAPKKWKEKRKREGAWDRRRDSISL